MRALYVSMRSRFGWQQIPVHSAVFLEFSGTQTLNRKAGTPCANRRLRRRCKTGKLTIEILAKLVSLHGAPRYLRSDNGPEFVSGALLRWSHAADIDTAVIDDPPADRRTIRLERWSAQSGD